MCACKKKALLCESDKYSEFEYTRNLYEYDPEGDIWREHGTDGLLAKNLRVLQVKDLDHRKEEGEIKLELDSNRMKKEFEDVYPDDQLLEKSI